MCERRYRVGEQWYNFRPDALAQFRMGSQNMRFWLEWDRGTMNVRDLSIKFSAYGHFVTSREWVREDARVPRLFCIAPDIAQEKRVRRVAHAKLAHTSGLVVCTTTEVLLNEHGPLAPIWLLGTQGYDQGGLTGSVQRYGWSQLIRMSRYFSTLLRISDATVSFRHPATRISAPSIGPVVNPNGILASIPEGS